MTIPTDGRIDLDALAELAKKATPGPWTPRDVRGLDAPADCIDFAVVGGRRETARVWTEADTRFIAALNPATVLSLIDLARRAAIPSEQGEAVKRWDLEPDNVQGFLVISATESPDGRWVKAEDALRAALPPSPAVVPEGWQPGERELARRWIRGLLARLNSKPDYADDCLWLERLYTLLAVSPSPPALDGAGSDAVIEECAKVAFERAHDNHKKANAYGANGDGASQLSCMTAAVEAMEIAAALRALKETP